MYDVSPAVSGVEQYNVDYIILPGTEKEGWTVLYHADDLDGHLSAWSALYGLRKNGVDNGRIRLLGVSYGDPVPDIQDDNIIIVDFSFPLEIMLLWNANKQVLWFDHHASVEKAVSSHPRAEELRAIKGVRVESVPAACQLVYEYFCGIGGLRVPQIVRYISDYDTYSFVNRGEDYANNTLAVQYYCRAKEPKIPANNSLGWSTEWYDFWMRLTMMGNKEKLQNIISEGNIAVSYENSLLERQMRHCATGVLFDGYEAVIHYGYSSLLFYKYKFPPAKVGVMIHATNNGEKVVFSLRSLDGETDVSAIAKRYGGGGHAGAAGFVVSPEEFLAIMDMIYSSASKAKMVEVC